MKLIICAKCGTQSSNIVWVKRMVYVIDFAPDYFIRKPINSFEADLSESLSYARRELFTIVRKDLSAEKHAGESFYCKDCFKELEK